ncbi:hypothetical protein X727_08990 [Mesorhizobium sp. L103C119B0]|nr:hypothetical protein X727_08990 [Mesorhizobium sp. L103C119B0]
MLLAAFVLLGPGRNYYVQWSAIKKIQAAVLAKDYREQFHQISVLADMGNADAQYNLGLMYWRGQGIAQNDRQATYWWGKAAEQGNADAASLLAQARGRGIAKDEKSAEFWLLEAAKAGNVEAELNLGKLYYTGIGGKPNYPESAKWFSTSASHGNAEARTFLEMMKEKGQFDSKTL